MAAAHFPLPFGKRQAVSAHLATRSTRWQRSHSRRCTHPSIRFRRTPHTSASGSEAAPALGCASNARSCSQTLTRTSPRQRTSLEPPRASAVLPPAQIEGGCRLLTCLDLGRLARVIASGATRGHLVSLSLEPNLFGNAGCELLASGLLARAPGGGPALPTLAELELKDNQIGGSGTASLARAFAAVPSLRYLGLADNRVDDVGVSAIALGAAALPRLAALDFSLNHRIAAQGMRALTKALAAGAWPHMPARPRRDPRVEAAEGRGRLRAGFDVPPLDDKGLLDELLAALDARQQAAVARQEVAAI